MAGGTSLSLQCGHRLSYDFGFFTNVKFNSNDLKNILSSIGNLEVIYQKDSTLHCTIDSVNVTFLYYPNKLIDKCNIDNNLKYASLMDIAVMKLVALSSRGARKDYFDLYYLIKYKNIDIIKVFDNLKIKFEGRDTNLFHIVQSLTYFEDALNESEIDMIVKIDFNEIKDYFITVQKILIKKYLIN
ncbi:MAG: nucleotidyl transferase AbiEii/AbiGii toxin family protein [Clostridia bacterium]